MAFLDRTMAVGNKIVDDIKKVAYTISVIFSLSMIGYYIFSVIVNFDNTFRLILNVCFLCIALISFIMGSVNHKNNTKSPKFRRVLKIIKISLNAIMLSVNGYNLFSSESSMLEILLWILLVVFLIVQILVEIISTAVTNYSDLLKTAVMMDIEPITKFMQPKNALLEIIDAPLEKLANKWQDKEEDQDEKEQYINELAEKFTETRKEQRKAKRKAQKEETKQKKKSEIREHLEIIKKNLFKKKSSKE